MLDILIKPKELYPTESVPHQRIVSGGVYCWAEKRKKIEDFIKIHSPSILSLSPGFIQLHYPDIYQDIYQSLKEPDYVYIQYREISSSVEGRLCGALSERRPPPVGADGERGETPG